MPTFNFTSPQGTKYQLTGPEGATKEQAFRILQAGIKDGSIKPIGQTPAVQPQPQAPTTQQRAARAETLAEAKMREPMIQMGYGLYKTGQGLKQAKLWLQEQLGQVPKGTTDKYTRQVMAERQQIEAGPPLAPGRQAPLSPENKLGQLRQSAGELLPYLAVPGAAATATLPVRLAAGAAGGAAIGGTQFVEPGQSRAQNAIVGATLNALGPEAIRTAGKFFRGRSEATQAHLDQMAAENSHADNLLQEFRRMGYILPPNEARPNFLNSALESISGSGELSKAAATKNQVITNDAVRREFGLAKGTPLTPELFQAIRAQAGKAYNMVAGSKSAITTDNKFVNDTLSIGKEIRQVAKEMPGVVSAKPIEEMIGALAKQEFTPESAVMAVRVLRRQASANMKNSLEPEKYALGQAQREAADALDTLIERDLKKSGQGDLADQYKAARRTIAKSHDVEAALDEATGDVSAKKLETLMKRGRPMMGEFRKIALLSSRFRKAAAQGANPLAISGLDMLLASVGYASSKAGAEAGGHGLAGFLLFLRPGLRKLLLSKPYQRLFTRPRSYSIGQTRKMVDKILNNPEFQEAYPKLMAAKQAQMQPSDQQQQSQPAPAGP